MMTKKETFNIFEHITYRKPLIGEWIMFPTFKPRKVINIFDEKDYVLNNLKLGYDTYYYDDDELENLPEYRYICIISDGSNNHRSDYFISNVDEIPILDDIAVQKIMEINSDDILYSLHDYAYEKNNSRHVNRNLAIDYDYFTLLNDYINGIGSNILSKVLRKINGKIVKRDKDGFRYIKLDNNDIWKAKRIKTMNDRRRNFTKMNKKNEYVKKRKHTYNFIEKL